MRALADGGMVEHGVRSPRFVARHNGEVHQSVVALLVHPLESRGTCLGHWIVTVPTKKVGKIWAFTLL